MLKSLVIGSGQVACIRIPRRVNAVLAIDAERQIAVAVQRGHFNRIMPEQVVNDLRQGAKRSGGVRVSADRPSIRRHVHLVGEEGRLGYVVDIKARTPACDPQNHFQRLQHVGNVAGRCVHVRYI